MLDNILNWNTIAMIVVLVLTIHGGIRAINRYFNEDKKEKKSASLLK